MTWFELPRPAPLGLCVPPVPPSSHQRVPVRGSLPRCVSYANGQRQEADLNRATVRDPSVATNRGKMQPMQPMWTWVGFITLFAMMVSMAITWEKQVPPPAKLPTCTLCSKSGMPVPRGRLTRRRDGRRFGSTWAGRGTTRHNSVFRADGGGGAARSWVGRVVTDPRLPGRIRWGGRRVGARVCEYQGGGRLSHA